MGQWDFDFGGEETQRKSFTQRERMAVWDTEFGPGKDRAKCPICKRNEITRHHFAMGHKKSLANSGTNTLRNVRPICHQCNSMMGKMNMAEYIRKYAPKTVSAGEKAKTAKTAKTEKATKTKKPTTPKKKKRPSTKSDTVSTGMREIDRSISRTMQGLKFNF
jgi:phage FluMu protein Com